jgi:hypothetical protein
MPKFLAARMCIKNQDVIFVLLEIEFGSQTDFVKRAVLSELQRHVRNGGLVGKVVGVWGDGEGGIEFMGQSGGFHMPSEFDMQWLADNFNLMLGWPDN